MSEIVRATAADIPAWYTLAAEVEPLFGPMVSEPGFQRALAKNIARGTALCVRAGAPGSALLGGLLYSAHPPRYTIGWLAVARRAQRQGIGRQLVAQVLEQIQPPAQVQVTTFGAEHPGGPAARAFYARLGFQAAEAAPDGPDGGARQLFRRSME